MVQRAFSCWMGVHNASLYVALTEHLLQIAEQKRFDRLLHNGFPLEMKRGPYPLRLPART